MNIGVNLEMNLGSVARRRPSTATTHPIPLIGIDIGQKHDPTAICVAELVYRKPDDPERTRREAHFMVRHLERLPLRTPYPEIARRLGEICQRVAEQSGGRPDIYVDATGVGTPVVDILKSSSRDMRFVWAVYFTHGDQRLEKREERKVSLGKAFLVSRVQALLQCRQLHLPNTAEARALAQELLDYEIRVDENANDRYGAFRVGTHDDLVTALGLAVQKEPTVSVYPRGD